MRIHLVTNLDNGKGLERDYRLLHRVLEQWGHEVHGVHFQRTEHVPPAELAIFLEVYEARFAALAPRRWLIPNIEWWSEERTQLLGDFEFVLCKTSDALARLAQLTPRARWLGFLSTDQHDPSVVRARRFLHVAGGSAVKGTDAILQAWAQYRLPYPLTLVSSWSWGPLPAGVESWGRVDEARLRGAQNHARFHLCPSHYEGWGHHLHEGLSVGAAVVVTDAPPLSAVAGTAVRIPPAARGTQGLARTALVSPSGIRDAVERCVGFSDAELGRVASAAREAFLDERERFLANLWEMLGRDGRAPPAAVASSRPSRGGPRVSIVFPCHAAAAPLVRRSVHALRAQTATPDQFEVVIACDGGDSGGVLRAAVAPDSHPFQVNLVESARPHGEIPHRNHARNAGWRAARGGICWMLDADFLLPPEAVEHLLAEHDAALVRGLPAVFTPVLARVALPAEAWLDRSAAWASAGSAGEYSRLLREVPIGGGVFSGYDERYRAGRPSSTRLDNVPEGMPAIWRGLLEALGGFDEWFVGWGAEKEALVDLVKGVQRSGLVDVRLLTSVRAIHQPHPLDPEAKRPDVRRRQDERERRAAQICQGERWWRERLDGLLPRLEGAIRAAAPPAALERAPAQSARAIAAGTAQVASILAVTAPLLRGLHGGVVVLGDAAAWIAERVTHVCGLETRSVEEAELATVPSNWACGVILSDVPSMDGAMARARLLAEVRRVVKAGGALVIVERADAARAPDSLLSGLVPACEHVHDGVRRVIRSGRVVSGLRAPLRLSPQ